MSEDRNLPRPTQDSAGNTVPSSQYLEALFKDVYADKLERLVPDAIKIQKDIKFSEADKLGDKFIQPVMLTEEHGFTFSDSEGSFAIDDAVVAEYKDVILDGVSIMLTSNISYTQAARANNGKRKSFETATFRTLAALKASMMKRIEVLMLYGNSPTGLATLIPGATLNANEEVTLAISNGDWAPGIWAGAENAKFDLVHKDDNVVAATVTINRVNAITRQLTFTPDKEVANGTYYFVYSGSHGKMFDGLDKILTTPADENSTLFGLANQNYPDLWKANTTTIGGSKGDVNIEIVLAQLAKAVGKGLTGDVVAYISADGYEKLNEQLHDWGNDTTKRREIDASYSKNKLYLGTRSVSFVYQNGMVTIKPSLYVKGHDTFILPTKVCKRIGATDVTFKTPGFAGDTVFHRMEHNAGYSVRCYTNQALFVEYPAHCIKIHGSW